LAAGLRLASRDLRVTIYEQGPRPGGKLNTFERDGYHFDTGPSLITLPQVFRELYNACGEQLEEHLTLQRLAPHCTYHFSDGTSFTMTPFLGEWIETLRRLDPRDVDGWLRFMQLGARLFALSEATFFATSPGEPYTTAQGLRAIQALRHLPLNGWGNYGSSVNAHFHSPYLRQLFNRYPTYVGSSPYAAPATFALIPYLEFTFGAWFIRGGLYKLASSLVQLCQARGAEVRCGCEVTRIERSASGKISAVQLASGERNECDLVVFNGESQQAESMLCTAGDQPSLTASPRLIVQAERSLSGVVLLLALRRTMPQLAHHNVFFSSDYPAEFAQLFGTDCHPPCFPDDPTVYVNVASRSDRSLVPADGGETVFIMANSPALDTGWNRAQLSEIRGKMLRKLELGGFPKLSEQILFEEMWTPAKLAETYGLSGGAIYGRNSHGWRNAFMRTANRSRRVPGLYFVGGSAHPGGGTPTVLMSARIAVNLIERDYGLTVQRD
jgi:phytoene desaturase